MKVAGVPQTPETISAASRPKFTILWAHVEEILPLYKFFPVVDTCLSCKDIARQTSGMVPRWEFLRHFGEEIKKEERRNSMKIYMVTGQPYIHRVTINYPYYLIDN